MRSFLQKLRFSLWQPDCPLKRARRNSAKAIFEERVRSKEKLFALEEWREEKLFSPPVKTAKISRGFLPSLEHILSKKKSPLKLYPQVVSKAGHSPKMEDFHFILEEPAGFLAAVFDGHGGKEAAEIACPFFKENFFPYLRKHSCPLIAMEKLFEKAGELIKTPAGTTALLCFVDKGSHAIYTATLGDSEAKVYRPKNKKIFSLPLSCVRDWSCSKEQKRAGPYLTGQKSGKVKDLRVFGLNVSRALGDSFIPQVSTKPKLSLNRLQKGDTLLLASDGLWDYTFEGEVIEHLFQGDAPNVETLANFTLDKVYSPDNLTILCMQIF